MDPEADIGCLWLSNPANPTRALEIHIAQTTQSHPTDPQLDLPNSRIGPSKWYSTSPQTPCRRQRSYTSAKTKLKVSAKTPIQNSLTVLEPYQCSSDHLFQIMAENFKQTKSSSNTAGTKMSGSTSTISHPHISTSGYQRAKTGRRLPRSC